MILVADPVWRDEDWLFFFLFFLRVKLKFLRSTFLFHCLNKSPCPLLMLNIVNWPYQVLLKLNSEISVASQITQHKWAWPFLEPVDVKGLGLHDYYEVMPFLCFQSFSLSLELSYLLYKTGILNVLFYLKWNMPEYTLLKKGLSISLVNLFCNFWHWFHF